MPSARASIAKVQQKGIEGLAWVSLYLGFAAGTALTATPVRSVISGVFGFFPSWVATVAFWVLLVAAAIDILKDLEPNQVAVYSVMALPSVAESVPGKMSVAERHLSSNLLSLLTDKFGAWLGAAGAFGVAVLLVAITIVIAKRVVKPKAG